MGTTARYLGALACTAGILLAPEANAQLDEAIGLEIKSPPGFRSGAARMDDAEAAGLPRGSRPEILTWERVYRLALARSQSRQPAAGSGLADRVDPKALDQLSAKLGLDDFARFRTDFLASRRGAADRAGATFRDPSAIFFDVLRRRHAVETVWGNVLLRETLLGVNVDLIKEGASALTQLDIDKSDLARHRAVRRLEMELTGYRDRLDELKVELGLSPEAQVVPDMAGLGVFHETFESATRWQQGRSRNLEDLPGFADRLPKLDGLALEDAAGRPVPAAARDDTDLLESLLAAARRSATGNRNPKDSEVDLRLRVRRGIRKLLETSRAYEVEKKEFVLGLRMKDVAFESLIGPPQQQRPPVSSVLKDLNEAADLVSGCEERLVALWIAYQGGRLALYRELGVFPYRDWTSFYAQFQSRRGDGGNKPGQAPSPPQVAPAPPASPAPPEPRPKP